jgi:hypothetical protein
MVLCVCVCVCVYIFISGFTLTITHNIPNTDPVVTCIIPIKHRKDPDSSI